MTENVGYATLSVIPSFDGFERRLDSGTSRALTSVGTRGGSRFGGTLGKSTGAAFGKTFRTAAKVGIAGALAVTAGAIKLGADAITAAQESQKISRQTAAVIKSTGGAARVSQADVAKLAGQLSYLGGVDDELVQSSANVLLTFKNIRNVAGKNNRIFDRGAKVALNMSTALGTDLKGASIQVGKALNDPVKGIAALARVGVTFTTKQKAQIKALVEGGDANAAMALGLIDTTTTYNNLLKDNGNNATKVAAILTKDLNPAQQKLFDLYAEGGHTLEAQKRIINELGSEFGGSARSQATAADRLKVAFGNVEEELGKALLPMVQQFSRYLLREGVPAARQFVRWFKNEGVPAIKDLGEKLKPLAKELLPAAADAFKSIKAFAKDALPFAEGIVKSFNDMPDWVKKVLVGGAVGGVALKKSGLLGGLFSKGGILSGGGGGLLGNKPIPVFVTNPGGLGGGSPKPSGPAGGALKFLGLGALGAAVASGITLGVGNVLKKSGDESLLGAGSGGTGSTGSSFFDLDGTKGLDDASGKVEEFNRKLSATRATFAENKAAANDYFMFIKRGLPTEASTRFTVTGIDTAKAEITSYLALLARVAAHVDSGFSGDGSGSANPGQAPNHTPSRQASSRGTNVNIGTVNLNDPKGFEKYTTHKSQQAALGGYGR